MQEKVVEWCVITTDLCMKSEVWAAWWQGVGSVVAIVAAIGIAQFQQSRAQRALQTTERAATSRAGRLVDLYLWNLRWCLEYAASAAREGAKDFRKDAELLGEVSTWRERIELERLSFDAVNHVLNARLIAAEAVAYIGQSPTSGMGEADFAATFTRLAGRVQALHIQLWDVLGADAPLRPPPPPIVDIS